MTLCEGIWKITFTDDNEEGQRTQIWRLTNSGQYFTVERQCKDGSFSHQMGDQKLIFHPRRNKYFMITFLSRIQVKYFEKIGHSLNICFDTPG